MHLGRLAFVATLTLTIAIGAATVAEAAPNDPLYSKQWGPQQVRAEQAWATSRGTGAVIAIVDSGVDLDHPDLAGKLLTGKTFLECEVTDEHGACGNGDWESGPSDRREFDSPHGTHVAGIAAAATGNGIGIAGVAPDAKLLPVKALDEEGGSFADIALGIRYAADQGAKVINLSLGAPPGFQALTLTGLLSDVTDAIAHANRKGAVVVAAAGNEAAPLCDTPAFDPGALCVAASERREAKASYSNLPAKPGFDAVAAPGGEHTTLLVCDEGIVSTVPPGEGDDDCDYRSDKAYAESGWVGTSMATPHVAGVAALLAAQGHDRTEILRAITSTARNPYDRPARRLGPPLRIRDRRRRGRGGLRKPGPAATARVRRRQRQRLRRQGRPPGRPRLRVGG